MSARTEERADPLNVTDASGVVFQPWRLPESHDHPSNATDPNGGLSLFNAPTKQLGLKLGMQKRSLPVIDHIEEKPTEN